MSGIIPEYLVKCFKAVFEILFTQTLMHTHANGGNYFIASAGDNVIIIILIVLFDNIISFMLALGIMIKVFIIFILII